MRKRQTEGAVMSAVVSLGLSVQLQKLPLRPCGLTLCLDNRSLLYVLFLSLDRPGADAASEAGCRLAQLGLRQRKSGGSRRQFRILIYWLERSCSFPLP